MRFFKKGQWIHKNNKKWILSLALIVFCILPSPCFAEVGTHLTNPEKVVSYSYFSGQSAHVFNHVEDKYIELPLYKLNHKLYFVVEDLQYMGYDLKYDNVSRKTNMVFADKAFASKISPVKKKGRTILSDIKVFIDGNFVPTYNMGGYSLAPLKYLKRFTQLRMTVESPLVSSFTGTLRLPKGDVAPKGGLHGEILLFGVSRADLALYHDKTIPVKIPEGESSVSFSCEEEIASRVYGVSYWLDSDRYVSAVKKEAMENEFEWERKAIPLYKFLVTTDVLDYPVDKRHFDISVVKDYVNVSGTMKLNNVPAFWNQPDVTTTDDLDMGKTPRYFRLNICQEQEFVMNTFINFPVSKGQEQIDFSIKIPKVEKAYTLKYDMPVFGRFPESNFPLGTGYPWAIFLMSGVQEKTFFAEKNQQINMEYNFPIELPKNPFLNLSQTGSVIVDGQTYTTFMSSEGDLFPLENLGVGLGTKKGTSSDKLDLYLLRDTNIDFIDNVNFTHMDKKDVIKNLGETPQRGKWLNYTLYGFLSVSDKRIPVYQAYRGLNLIKVKDIPKINWSDISGYQ